MIDNDTKNLQEKYEDIQKEQQQLIDEGLVSNLKLGLGGLGGRIKGVGQNIAAVGQQAVAGAAQGSSWLGKKMTGQSKEAVTPADQFAAAARAKADQYKQNASKAAMDGKLKAAIKAWSQHLGKQMQDFNNDLSANGVQLNQLQDSNQQIATPELAKGIITLYKLLQNMKTTAEKLLNIQSTQQSQNTQPQSQSQQPIQK